MSDSLRPYGLHSLPGSLVNAMPRARILEWISISFSKGDLPDPKIEPTSLMSPALAGGFFTSRAKKNEYAKSNYSHEDFQETSPWILTRVIFCMYTYVHL